MGIINIDVFTFKDITDAIQSAKDKDTINLFIQNDIVFSNEAEILKTLAINLINAGSHKAALSITPGDIFRHFATGAEPVPNVSVTVGCGLILDGGSTGGGLFIFGSNCSVTLNGCTFIHCKNTLNGGAVQVVGDTARNTLIINNDTTITNCSAGFGGGIVASGCNVILNGGKITGNTAIISGGGLSVDGRTPELGSTFTINGGRITGNTALTNNGGGINVQNTIVTMPGGEISSNTARVFGGGIYAGPHSYVNIAGGMIQNNTANNGGGAWIAYDQLANLTVAPDAIFYGNSASRGYNRSPADDGLYYSHIFATRWTIPFIQGYNNFDIGSTNGTPFTFPAEVAFSAVKFTAGTPLEAGQFTFAVLDKVGNPVARAVNDAEGEVLFPTITFDHPGIFKFSICEIGVPTGWIPDSRFFPAVVTVTEHGNGQLVAKVSFPDGLPRFTDTFGQPSKYGKAVVRAKIHLLGGCLQGNDFSFAVLDKMGNEAAKAINDPLGNIVFPKLTFTQPGVFKYKVRVLNPSNCNFYTDDRVFPIIVIVKDKGTGKLVTTVRYPRGRPVFINQVISPGLPCDCRHQPLSP